MRVCLHARKDDGSISLQPLLDIFAVRRLDDEARTDVLTQILAARCRYCGSRINLQIFWTEEYPHADFRSRIFGYGSGPFTLKRIAIHAADIQKFKLPPLRVKAADPRSEEFLRKYSDKCVELDALPPNELRRRIREAVEGLLDIKLWNRAIAVEKIEIASIKDTVSRWPTAEAD